jgi:hypothetical protein
MYGLCLAFLYTSIVHNQICVFEIQFFNYIVLFYVAVQKDVRNKYLQTGSSAFQMYISYIKVDRHFYIRIYWSELKILFVTFIETFK